MDTEMMDSCPPAVTITTTTTTPMVDNNHTPSHVLNAPHNYSSHAPLPASSFSADSFAQYYNNPVPGLLSPPFFADHQLAMNITNPTPMSNLNSLGPASPFALSMASAAPPLLTLSPRDAMIKEDPNKEYNDYYLSQLDKVPSFFGPAAMSSSSYPGDNPLQLVISNNDDDKLHFDNDLYYHTRDDDLFFDLDDEFDDMDPPVNNTEGVVGMMEMDNYDTDYDSNDYDDYDDLMFSSEEDMDDDYDDSKSAVNNASSSTNVNATTAPVSSSSSSTINPNTTNMTAPVSTPVVMMPASNKSSDLAAASYRQTHNPPREVISNDSSHLPVTTTVHKNNNNNTTTNNNNNNVHNNVHNNVLNNNTYHHHHPIPSSSLSASSHRCDMINHNTNEPCHKVFSRPYDLVRHQDTIHAPVRQKFACELCGNGGKTFSRMDALSRHIRVKHADAVGYPTPAATITHINH